MINLYLFGAIFFHLVALQFCLSSKYCLFLKLTYLENSMIRKYHNHKLQTNQWHPEEGHTTITRHQEDKKAKQQALSSPSR